jgi:uncharacterized protein YbjQ (UPF0145 family)
MILTNTEHVANYTVVEHYTIVVGSTVRAKNFLKDFFADIKNTFGGEIKPYYDLVCESRKEATLRMIDSAKDLGANAILNIRFQTTLVNAGVVEVLAYGTAAKLTKNFPE